MEEISLKEVMITLYKGKTWILLTTLAFLFIALLYGFFQPKKFTSETVLKVNAIDINPTLSHDSSIIGDIAAIAQFPVMDVNSYTQQLMNNQVLEHTISVLALQDKRGERMQAEDLKQAITIKSDEKTNILYVSVADREAQSAADLTNALVEQFIVYLTELINQNCREASENISKQLEIQREKIVLETKKLQDYANRPNNARTLESATESMITQITRYKSDLNDMQRNIHADRLAVAGLREETTRSALSDGISADQLKINIPSGVNTRRVPAGAEDPNSAGSSIEITVGSATAAGSASDIENAVMAVKKAELEARLVQNEADYNALLTRLSEMENSLAQMMSTLAEEQQDYEILRRDYLLAGEIYGKYQKIYQQIPVIASSDLARKNIQILSYGTAAIQPENPGVWLCVAIGGVLGLFIGAFAVLFKNYWAQA